MKFRRVDPAGVDALIPPWVAPGISLARALDQVIPPMPLSAANRAIPFWIEVDMSTGAVETKEPDAGVDLCGRLVVHGFERNGSRRMIDAPLNSVLRGYQRDGDYCLYAHGIQTETPLGYVGVSSRRWHVRYGEHESAANSGSPYLFHDALRRHQVETIVHRVIVAGVNRETAFALEEEFVAAMTLYPLGLNMIPGGEAGIRYLAARGFPQSVDRSRAIAELMTRETVNGRPNPLCSARWASDPDYAARVICGHSGRLTVDQVRMVRALTMTARSASEVAAIVGAGSERQVRDAMRGATYGRVA